MPQIQSRPNRIGPARPAEEQGDDDGADMVTALRNSARKNRANRSREYSVWKPPTSPAGLDQVERRRFSSAVAADEDDERHRAGDPEVPAPGRTGSDDAVGAEAAAGHQHDGEHRQAEGGLVGDHLGRGADRAEQRVLQSPTTSRRASRRRPPPTTWPGRGGCRWAGRQLGEVVWPKISMVPVRRPEVARHRDDDEGRNRDQETGRRQLEHRGGPPVRASSPP